MLALFVVEVEVDISHDPEQAVFLLAYPAILTYVEVGEESQEGSCLMVARIVVRRPGEEQMLVRRRRRELLLRRDPLGGGLGRSRRRVAELDVGVQWLSRGLSWRVFSFGRGRRGVVQGVRY